MVVNLMLDSIAERYEIPIHYISEDIRIGNPSEEGVQCLLEELCLKLVLVQIKRLEDREFLKQMDSKDLMLNLKTIMQDNIRNRPSILFDNDLFALGMEEVEYYMNTGVYNFIDISTFIIKDLGCMIRPYLKAIYNGARYMPKFENHADEMTPESEVSSIDVNTIALPEPKTIDL